MGAFVRGLVPVRREERGLALLLFVFLTLMVLADWIGKIGADSLFVKRFGVQNIPAMYILTPLAMLASSAAIFAFVGRVRRRTLLSAFVAIVMVASVVIQLAIPLGGAIFPIAYIFAHGVKETIYLLFWIYVGNLYDSEQAKRLFPLFAGAVLVGKILGGVLSVPLADLIHAENFIGSQAVGFLAALLLIAAYWRHLPEGAGADARRRRARGPIASVRESVDGYRTVASDSLMRRFGVGIFFWYFLMQIGSYLYLVGLDTASAVAASRASEDLFSQMYASVYTSGTFAALAIQFFLTGGLVRRAGLAWTLLVFPAWYLATYTGAFVALNFVTAVAIQLGERVVVPAIHRPATELVYSQVEDAIRPRARAFLSGGVNAFGNIAAAGLLIGTAALGLTSTIVLGLAGVFSLLFVANTWTLRRTLGERIAANLASADPSLRRNALLMLPSDGGTVPTAALRAILPTASEDVSAGIRAALARRGALAISAETVSD